MLLRVVLGATGVAAIAAAAMISRPSLLFVALLSFLPVATALSQAGRGATRIRCFEHRFVSAVVWGVPIRGASPGALRVESVGAAGAGLLVYLRSPMGARTLFKVAQPRSWRFNEGSLIIDEAAYVQWAGE